jgi:hypothetical protein
VVRFENVWQANITFFKSSQVSMWAYIKQIRAHKKLIISHKN